VSKHDVTKKVAAKINMSQWQVSWI